MPNFFSTYSEEALANIAEAAAAWEKKFGRWESASFFAALDKEQSNRKALLDHRKKVTAIERVINGFSTNKALSAIMAEAIVNMQDSQQESQ